MITKNVYSLPFDKKFFTKAISDPRVHFAHFKNAVDFLLEEETLSLLHKMEKLLM